MLNQIPLSQRLALLLSGIWLFLSGIFSLVIGPELFSDFESTGGFLVSWLFVGVMPLGLAWGVAWVISGYRREHSQIEVREPEESSEVETTQRRTKNYRLRILEIDYRKGLRRLWIIGTVVWYSYAFIASGYQIGKWVGFHYSLLAETKSFTRAAAEKRKYVALVVACNKAQFSTCWVPPYRANPDLFLDRKYLPDCEKTQAFRDVFNHELRASGVALPPGGAHGEACPDIVAVGIPTIDWTEFWLTTLAPFCLMFIYWIGRWIIKGFARHSP
ncbi:hypothetical protein [Pseudogulbenkiania sp. MAI-1]|uniref:hypothetical protein n=1 Tax=Pseudogulbenkiania sp. MAI-1 TaxID=990370 RepID=UPI0012EC4681|nr:hypothetical protein [Pseudogulbenkiania sp. MAI-1]